MVLSAPIYALKRKAKLLSRQRNTALHRALDSVAIEEGFQSWSHLVSSQAQQSPAMGILSELKAGELILIGARPGHGKTLLALELAVKAPQIGRKGYFFTLDYHERDVAHHLATMGIDGADAESVALIDTSDSISADYIIRRINAAQAPALIVVDYLQLLDQKRTHPSLSDQVETLKRYAARRGAVCVFISQIDRSFDLSGKPMPDRSDIRLPNPLDLSVFHKCFFLHEGKIQMDHAA